MKYGQGLRRKGWGVQVLLAAAVLATASWGAGGDRRGPTDEVRAVWVVRTDLASPDAVRRVVATVKRAGLNTIIAQVRGRGDAYYRGGREPLAVALRGQPPTFDPLDELLRQAGPVGLKVHAWINMIYVWSEPNPPPDPGHLVNAHRDWLAVDVSGGRLVPGSQTGVYLCPSHPQARRHLREVCADVAARYAVDGIHLDYIRYPNHRTCYCLPCRARFKEWLITRGESGEVRNGSIVRTYPAEWHAWRREQITTLVAGVREEVRRVRPEAALSAAVVPWGSYTADFRRSAAFATVGQDWSGWIRAGLVHAVAPMTYHTSLAAFRGWVHGVTRDHPGFPVWFGIGAYLCSAESSSQKIAAARQTGAAGWSLFSYGSMTRECGDETYLRAVAARLGLMASRQ